MGCDIHGFIQTKRWMGPYWYDAMNLSAVVGRNYDAFSRLFGVRSRPGDPDPLAYERGIPEDAGEFIENEANCVDWHSHSWIGYSELKEVYGDLSGDWQCLIDIMEILDKNVDKENIKPELSETCRLIVWFDN